MRAVFALVLVVGMALAGAAVYMAQNYLGQTQADLARAKAMTAKTGRLVQVYAVNKSMKYGDPLTEADVSAIYIQESYLPIGAYRVPKEGAKPEETAAPEKAGKPAKVDKNAEVIIAPTGPLFPENTDKPRFMVRGMEPNEIILASRVTEPGQVAGLVAKLDPGMRAFQIKVDTASGVAGFVQPDDRIDIYWTGVSSGNINGEVTRLIESSVRIIAVDQASGEGQSSSNGMARTVTVTGTPETVARLAQAQATGRLAMSLVGNGAEQLTGLVEVDSNSLLGIQAQEVVQAEVAKVCTIKTRRGADVIDIPIPCTN